LRLKLASVLLVGLVAIAAGCGGSSKSAAEATTETTTQAATTTEAETTTAAAETTTATETTATVTETTTTGGGSTSFANAKNCAKLFGLSAEFAKAFSQANAKNDYQASAKFFQEFADKTPKEIRSDFQVLAKALTAYAQALGKVHLKPGATPTPQQIAALEKAAASFNQGAFTKANTHIHAWAQKNCHS
jgi:hypothetical protein